MKKEQPQSQSAEMAQETNQPKPERPTVDSAHSREVGGYYTNLAELEGAETDPQTADYIAERRKSLDRLSDPKNLEELQYEDFGMALGDLTSKMSINNPNIESNLTGNAETDEKQKDFYLQSKELFMGSCAKVFPETRADASDLNRVLANLRKSMDTVSVQGEHLTGSTIEKLKKEKPEQLIQEIDAILYSAGSALGDRALDSFQEEDENAAKKFKQELGLAAEQIYKLQLIRDSLEKQIYDKDGLLPKEKQEAENLREEIQNKPSGVEGLKEARKRVGTESNLLQDRMGAGIRIPNLGENVEKWEKLAEGLALIRKEYVKDRRLRGSKNPEYKKKIAELLETLK